MDAAGSTFVRKILPVANATQKLNVAAYLPSIPKECRIIRASLAGCGIHQCVLNLDLDLLWGHVPVSGICVRGMSSFAIPQQPQAQIPQVQIHRIVTTIQTIPTPPQLPPPPAPPLHLLSLQAPPTPVALPHSRVPPHPNLPAPLHRLFPLHLQCLLSPPPLPILPARPPSPVQHRLHHRPLPNLPTPLHRLFPLHLQRLLSLPPPPILPVRPPSPVRPLLHHPHLPNRPPLRHPPALHVLPCPPALPDPPHRLSLSVAGMSASMEAMISAPF